MNSPQHPRAAAAATPGRDAKSPTEIPAMGWWQVAKRVYAEQDKDNLGLVAAGVAFYFFLAFVPLLGALVMTYGLVADPQEAARHVEGLAKMLPADAAKLIGDQLLAVVKTAGSAKGFGLIVSLGLAIYGAMKGASAIITALNIAYEEEETRGFVKTTLLSAAMTVGIVLVAIAAIVAVTVLGAVGRLLEGLGPVGQALVQAATWAALAAIVAGALATAYRYGPNRDRAKWAWLTPGSILATVGWIVATLAFGFYVTNFGSYNATYGSLGAVVVLLLWLWLSAFVVLLGAELNAELEHQTARDTTQGAEQPLGTRGATMADRVANG